MDPYTIQGCEDVLKCQSKTPTKPRTHTPINPAKHPPINPAINPAQNTQPPSTHTHKHPHTPTPSQTPMQSGPTTVNSTQPVEPGRTSNNVVAHSLLSPDSFCSTLSYPQTTKSQPSPFTHPHAHKPDHAPTPFTPKHPAPAQPTLNAHTPSQTFQKHPHTRTPSQTPMQSGPTVNCTHQLSLGARQTTSLPTLFSPLTLPPLPHPILSQPSPSHLQSPTHTHTPDHALTHPSLPNT